MIGKILLANANQFVAFLYWSTLALGTKIEVGIFPLQNPVPKVGGVIALIVIELIELE
jgi:hypothetical protein